jgi:hypothetical protein
MRARERFSVSGFPAETRPRAEVDDGRRVAVRVAFGIVLGVHALIHLMGFLKAFDLARLAQLTVPIPRAMGIAWLLAAVLLLAATFSLLAAPRGFWLLAACGVTVSQIVIVASWRDARFGSVLNGVTLAWIIYGAVSWGPFGLRAEYEERTSRGIASLARTPPLVTEEELAPLPGSVQRYLRYVGVLGQPHVGAFCARFSGRIRSGPTAPWMSFVGEQHNFMAPRTRLFWMQATMKGLPVDALHAYDVDGARMRVKLLSLFSVVDQGGRAFTKAETVTLLNDMCIMAPATLVDAPIQWKELDARSVEATFTNGAHTVRAVLIFDDAGPLVNFWSDDRPSLAPDGVTFLPQRWSTPIGDYRSRGAVRLASRGEARYAAPDGEYTYIEFDDLDVSYDVGRE